MKRQFYLKRSTQNKRLYEIDFRGETYGISPQSLQIFPARLLGLSYPQYLKTCIEDLNAEIVLKDTVPIPIFEKNKLSELFTRILNARLGYIVFEKNHPYDIVENEDGVLVKVPFAP